MSEAIKNDSKIKAVPNPTPEIGVDTENEFISTVVNAASDNELNLSEIENFSMAAQTREQIYSLVDTMAQDSTIASILETYAEDVCETNDRGKIVWVESNDEEIAKQVDFLLNVSKIDKQIYDWAYSLCKYGDVYVQLYRKSDFETPDDVFDNKDKVDSTNTLLEAFNSNLNDKEEKEDLKENVNVIINKPNDNYAYYIEKKQNPAQYFELTQYGKTVTFIEAPVTILNNCCSVQDSLYFKYNLNKSDVNIYSACDFVHGKLDSNQNRTCEEVEFFYDSKDNTQKSRTYKVNKGQSMLATNYQIWRELTLLENSVLLNRVTKSSILRLIQVEVGDMPKDAVKNHLSGIKQMFEQHIALNKGKAMGEYTNPGPVENNIYIPTHNGIGAISQQSVGGDVDPKQLTDLSYFQDKLFGSFRVPKQYFGCTSDGAGFDGGKSLAIISSRYGKSIKHIQKVLCQMVTDIINLWLLDRGLANYINKFTIRMQAPVTQEDNDKRENISNRIRIVSDVMNTLNEVENPTIKLKILKVLLSSVVDPEVTTLLQEQIDELKAEVEEKESNKSEQDEDNMSETTEEPVERKTDLDDTFPKLSEIDFDNVEEDITEAVNQDEFADGDRLPTPEELGIDFTSPMKKG